MTDEVETLTEYARFALSNGKIKTYEDMLRFFAWVLEQTQESQPEIAAWLCDNMLANGEATMKEIWAGVVGAENPKPNAKKKEKPDLLTADAASEATEYFAMVPGSLARDTNVSATAFRIYVCLLLRAGNKGICWPSQDLLAKEVGLQVRQLRDHLKDLADAEWITIQRRRNKPSIYRVNHTVKNRRS
jgi:helix-turn-helix protein